MTLALINILPAAAQATDTDTLSTTWAASSVRGDVLYHTPTANLTNTMYGLLPGLTAMQQSGEPGYDGAWLTIRGIGSYNYDSYSIYVDGFQTNTAYFQYLTPTEIESVNILKDAVALAPFGMKGANGVIWVTTKRGQVSKPKWQVQLRTGLQSPINLTKPLGSYDYAQLYNEAISNDNGRVWTPFYTQSQLNAYRDGTGVDVDWLGEVVRDQTPYTSADITFSGGGTAAKYFVMVSYVGSNGFYDVKNDDNHSNARLQQYNIRSNFDFTLFKIFDGRVDLGGRIEDRHYPGYNGGDLWNNLERYPANIYPIQNDNSTWTGTPTYPNNPVASIRETGYYSTHDRTLQVNFSLRERLDFITPGLYLKQAVSFSDWTRGSYDITRSYARFLNGVQQTDDQDTNYAINDDWGTNQWNWTQLSLSAGYDKQWGNHNIHALLNYLQYSYNVDANQNGSAGTNMEYGYQNVSGRVQYDYQNKYFAELSFAYSGSDNYRRGHRFGLYPALALAWKPLPKLKVRVSAGKTGYDTFSGGRYLYEQYFQYRNSYPTGNASPTWHGGIQPAYIANPDIFAEQSMKYNLGVDARLFDNKWNITFDAYMDKRSGIVTQDNSIMGTIGITTPPYRNVGKVTTKGIELSTTYTDRVGKVNYRVGGMLSYITDKIDYMAELATPSPYAMQTGKAIGAQMGYDAIGFYDVTDFNADGSLKELPVPAFGQVQPGDVKYRDLNDDDVINEQDMLQVGKPDYPNLTFAVNGELAWKGFDLRFLIQGAAGRDVNLLDKAWNKVVALADYGNVYEWAKERWAYYPNQDIDTRQTATYPRLSTLSNNNNYRTSTLWIKNGNFVRLRNVEIGWSLPKSILQKCRLSNARIFVSGVNLFTLSSLLSDYGIDPETYSGYPGVKSYNIGLSVGF
jgi:TonB-linked SusC/RagA family outer membrane protein